MDSNPSITTERHHGVLQKLLLRLLTGAVVTLALMMGAGSVYAAATTTIGPSLEIKSIPAGDSTWSYYEGGEGPTLLLVHGFSSNKDVWLSLAQKLVTRFHLIIPDLPGWGESTRIEKGNYDIDAQAARLDAFILALDLRNIVLVGHSMGGAIAGTYAADRQGRANRLALLGPQGLSFDENDFIRDLDAGKNPFVYDDRAGVERTTDLVYLNPPVMTNQQVDAAIAGNRANRNFIETTLKQIRNPTQWLALDSRLEKMSLPVLGIWCREDKVIDISASQTLRSGLADNRLKDNFTLEGCNHLPMIERPGETAKILTDFAIGN